VRVLGTTLGVDHRDWSYAYVIALAEPGLAVSPLTAESDELRWMDLDAVTDMPLHAGLARTWPALLAAITERLATMAP
jgi:8-oxo-dGTP diphosphatase